MPTRVSWYFPTHCQGIGSIRSAGTGKRAARVSQGREGDAGESWPTDTLSVGQLLANTCTLTACKAEPFQPTCPCPA